MVMSHDAPPTFEAIQAELDEIARMLRQAVQRTPEAPEVWRLATAERMLVALRESVGRTDLPAAERYWRVVGNLRGIFRGWADSPPEFEAVRPAGVGERMHALYDKALPFSAHQ